MKTNYKAFSNAVKARGGARYMALGGTSTLAPIPQDVTQNTALNPGAIAAKAGIGAAAGSVLPGLGTVAGGVLGATMGVAPALASALTPQNEYQAQLAPTTQIDYTPAISGGLNQTVAGYGEANQNRANEGQLEQQLMQQAAGGGPNPAQQALAANTATNVATTAAQAAGQRGASANAGLIARQAAQTGGNLQQKAVSDAATLEAQQRIAAQQGAAAVQGQIGNQIVNEQNANNGLYGANNAQNSNLITNYGNMQGINSGTAQNNANAVNKTLGGLTGGLSSIFSFLDEGGEVGVDGKKVMMADGGEAPGALSWVGKYLNNSPISQGIDAAFSAPQTVRPTMASNSEGVNTSQAFDNVGSAIKGKDSSPSDGASDIGGAVSGTGAGAEAGLFAKGGQAMVPGKAKVKGNSLKNDIVPAMLSPGEIVIPRDIAQHPDAVNKAAAFVAAIKAKQGLKKRR